MNDFTDLPLTMTHWGTYRVETEDGKVKKLHGFEEDLDPSPISIGMPSTLNDPLRITGPMVRRSWLENGPGSNNERRGAEPFVEVSWEQAEHLVADELTRVITEHGNESIYGGSYGWASAGRFHHANSQVHRFLSTIGGYTWSKDTYSHAAGAVMVPHVLGSFDEQLLYATSWPSIVDNAELVVAFGGLPLKNAQIDSGGVGVHSQRDMMKAAADAQIRFINISPLRTDVLDYCDAQWIQARPGTDTAIILGLCHTLLTEDLHDTEFLDRYTTGFDRFAPYLTGESDGIPKTAQWAAQISGLEESTILELARQMASHKTMLSLSWSLTRLDHGEQVYWSAIVLASMLGQIGLPGCGIGLGYSALNSIGSHRSVVPLASMPQPKNAVAKHIPVARVSDMLLNPGKPFDYNGYSQLYPDIKVVYWAGGNPFHHHQDINRMLEAWRRPDTIVVNEWCWNSLARHADIVLPCTTMLERNDFGASKRDPYLVSMSKAVEPPAGVRNDHDIFAGIAARMGKHEEFTEGRSTDEWIRWIYEESRSRCAEVDIELPSFESFCRTGWHKVPPPDEPVVMLSGFRQDPEKNPLKTPSGRIEIYSENVASFDYHDCPGHPVWLEPLERLGAELNPKYPLHLNSNQPPTKLHSQFDHGIYSKAAKIRGREPVILHPNDAAERGLTEGDVVRVFNDRGQCLGGVLISDNLMAGVVQMSTGSWYDPAVPGEIGSLCKAGNPNVLTPDKGTSRLGQGPSAHTCLVQVEKFIGTPPPVTIYEPPEIITT